MEVSQLPNHVLLDNEVARTYVNSNLDRSGHSARLFRTSDVVIVSDEQVHVSSWPLGVAEQAITGLDEFVRTVGVRPAKVKLIREKFYIILLDGVEPAHDVLIPRRRWQTTFKVRE